MHNCIKYILLLVVLFVCPCDLVIQRKWKDIKEVWQIVHAPCFVQKLKIEMLGKKGHIFCVFLGLL